MLYTLTLFVALFFSILLLMLGSGLSGTLVSLRMSLEGFGETLIGTIMSGFYVGLVAGSFICPEVVRRVGHIRAFAAFAATTTVATLLFPLFVTPPLWFAFRLLSGFTMMGLYMVVESWLADQTEPEMRGRVFSVYMALTFLGLGGSQFLLHAREISGSDLFLISGIFFALGLVPVALTRRIHPELPETSRMPLRKLARRAPPGLLGALSAGTIAGAFYSLGPVFALQSGFPVSDVAYFMGVTIFSGLALQWLVGNLSDRFDRCLVLSLLSLLVALASLGIILAGGRSILMTLILTGIYGGVAFTIYPVAVAHTGDRVENRDIVPASSALIMFYGLGACLGPVAAAAFMARIGPAGLYWFITAVTGLFSVMALHYYRKEKYVVHGEISYVPVPRTSPVINSLYPISELDLTEDEALEEVVENEAGDGS